MATVMISFTFEKLVGGLKNQNSEKALQVSQSHLNIDPDLVSFVAEIGGLYTGLKLFCSTIIYAWSFLVETSQYQSLMVHLFKRRANSKDNQIKLTQESDPLQYKLTQIKDRKPYFYKYWCCFCPSR